MKRLLIKIYKYVVVLLVIVILNNIHLTAQNDGLKKIINLSGLWSFSIGTGTEWKFEGYDDSNWEKIRVPSPWEDEGFQGYNGHAFYRKQVFISDEYKGQMLYLMLGYIDDVDEVYFNGEKIGSTGSFPPDYQTAYNAKRKYYIPEDLIRYNGRNLIAVKVYDSQQGGGIVSGDIGIFANSFGMSMDINLQGRWKFNTGDHFEWKNKNFDDTDWNKIFVPAKWEDQGYKRYDGYAWYRKEFIPAVDYTEENVVIVVGKIDDADQVFINGVLVGVTGDMPKIEGKRFSADGVYNAFRGYYFPSKLLKKNEVNIVAVRVYDKGGEGGIYEGPVGIIAQSKYIDFWRKRKKENKW